MNKIPIFFCVFSFFNLFKYDINVTFDILVFMLKKRLINFS